MSENKKIVKYDYLDSLRGIAILLVVLGHVGNMLGEQAYVYFPSLLEKFIYNGHLGVQMFFIVSAYTLMISYEFRKGESQASKKFFIRRFFRITPMYYLAFIFTTLQMIDFSFANFDWQTFHKTAFVTNILFVNALSPSTINNYVIGGWSISAEMLFYVMLPFICARIKTLNGMLTFTLLSLLFSSAMYILLENTSFNTNEFLRYYFINQIPIFGLGMTAFFITKEDTDKSIKPKVFLLLVITLFVYAFIDIPYAFWYSLIYFIMLLMQHKKAYKFFNNNILIKIGKVSFSIYLVHFALMYLIYRWNIIQYFSITDSLTAYSKFALLFILLTGLSYIISCFTYKYIEQNGQKLGRYIISKLP